MELIAFDFDGTLSESEMTVLLAERQGEKAAVDAITERAMAGELDYAESLRQRCALLEGLSRAEATAAFEDVMLRPGAPALLGDLQQTTVRTAILTGGFERGVTRALRQAGVSVDHVIANELEIADGKLTGQVSGPLIEGTKDDALASLCIQEGCSLAETVVVGDGANDLPMLEAAGLAIGFAPKPVLEPACDRVVTSMGELRELLEMEGLI